MKIIECVPNISEGRDRKKIREVVGAIRSVPGVRFLDLHSDVDHNRSVLTFAGPSESIGEVAFRCVEISMKVLTLKNHRGVHPRIGVVDVLPLVPLGTASKRHAINVARLVIGRLKKELGMNIYQYGALSKKHKTASDVRRQAKQSRKNIAVGVRAPLIAFNVLLRSTDVRVAERIARSVRESSGGLPAVQAKGFFLRLRKVVQVSMNLLDYRKTSLISVFRAVRALAVKHGVEIREGEIVGLLPRRAVPNDAMNALRLRSKPRTIEGELQVKKFLT